MQCLFEICVRTAAGRVVHYFNGVLFGEHNDSNLNLNEKKFSSKFTIATLLMDMMKN